MSENQDAETGEVLMPGIGHPCGRTATSHLCDRSCTCSEMVWRPDTLTITISSEDAEELLRVAEKREDPDSWVHNGKWAYASELRLQSKLRAALRAERD